MKAVTWNRLVGYFAVPLLATLLFIFFQLSPVRNWLAHQIPSSGLELIVLSSIFFILLYIFNRLIQNYLKGRKA